MADLVIKLSPALTTQQRKRRQLEALFRKQNGLCKWCKEPMLLFDHSKVVRHGRKGRTKLPKNLATIDHLDDRFSPERGKHGGELRHVAACWRCNGLRGQISQAMQPIEELRRRANGRAEGSASEVRK